MSPALSDQALRTLIATGRKLDPQDPAVVRQTAAQFLSELFFAPLLAEMRQFPFGRDFATGGQTEAIFGEQLDQRTADCVAAASPGLVDEMIRQFEQQRPGVDHSSWPVQTQLPRAAEDQRS